MTVAVKRFYYVDEDEELISSFQVSAHVCLVSVFLASLVCFCFDMRAKKKPGKYQSCMVFMMYGWLVGWLVCRMKSLLCARCTTPT